MTRPEHQGEQSRRAAIRDAIRELVASPLTNAHFEAVVERNPELLSELALSVVADLVPEQTEPAGREFVERLGAILARARVAGLKTAMLEFRLDVSPEAQADRLAQAREDLRVARRAARVRAPDGPDPALRAKGRAFDSLAACLDHLRTSYPQGTVSVAARDVARDFADEPASLTWEAPRFLFRGESGLFPHTPTSLARVRSDLSLSVETIEAILAVSIRVRDQLSEQFELSLRLAAGLLQHYGLATPFLDVSPDLDVAVQFATSLAVGDWGALAVLPVESLREPDSFMLADLTLHPMADRPRRQSAFAFLDRAHSDLKDPTAILDRDLSWHWFRFTAEDEEAHQPDPLLLDAHSDRVAGLIELLINDCARFDDAAARWIAERVPSAPMVLRVTGHDDSGTPTGILLSAEEAGAEVPGAGSGPGSDFNYQRWSSAFTEPDHGARSLDEPLPTTDAATDIPMGAIVTVLRSQILRPPRRDERDTH
jgi:hypothetical protein